MRQLGRLQGRDGGIAETACALRMTVEAAERGERVDAEAMAREIAERDTRDRTRSEAPLVQAPDAVYVDSTGLGIEQVEEKILKLIRERTSNGKGLAH